MATSHDTQIVTYWNSVLTLCDQLISDTSLLREWAEEIPELASEADRFTGIMNRVLADPASQSLRVALYKNVDSDSEDGALNDPGPQLVSRVNNQFVGGLRLLTQEVSARVQLFPHTLYHKPVLDLMQNDVHDLVRKFGSFTAAWDQLVILKYETSIADRRRRLLDSWFVSLISMGQRFIRDLIFTTVVHVGRAYLSDVIDMCFNSAQLQVPNPTVRQLLDVESSAEALADSICSYIDRSSRHATRFAGHFGNLLGISLFPRDDQGIRPGLLSDLPELVGTAEDALNSLLAMRRRLSHDSNLYPASSDSSPIEWLYTLESKTLGLVAEFIATGCHSFSMRMLLAVGQRSGVDHARRVDELRNSASGQHRVTIMRLLRDHRYEFAWALAESALQIEPDSSSGTMLRLNILFARRQLSDGFVNDREVQDFDVGSVPRYNLIKLVLLGITTEDRLRPLVEECLGKHDMALDEFDGWPVLESVRETAWWRRWRSQLG